MKPFLIFFLTVFMLGARAQITIDSTNFGAPGDKVYIAYQNSLIAPQVTAGNAGAAQFWDFNTLFANFNDSLIFLHPDSTNYSANIPNSTFAFETNNNYEFYRNDSSGLYDLGRSGDPYATGSSCTGNWTPPNVIMKWPATYGQQFTDSADFYYPPCSTSSSTNDSIELHYFYKTKVEADAWGTLQLPSGSYNVLRFKKTITHADTGWSYYNNNPWYVWFTAYGTYIEYEWWSSDPGVKYRLARMSMDTTSNMANWVEWVEMNGTTTQLHAASVRPVLVIYPNPAKDFITVSGIKGEKGTIKIADQTGKELRRFSSCSSDEKLLLDGLAPGVYFWQWYTHAGLCGTGKLIVRE